MDAKPRGSGRGSGAAQAEALGVPWLQGASIHALEAYHQAPQTLLPDWLVEWLLRARYLQLTPDGRVTPPPPLSKQGWLRSLCLRIQLSQWNAIFFALLTVVQSAWLFSYSPLAGLDDARNVSVRNANFVFSALFTLELVVLALALGAGAIVTDGWRLLDGAWCLEGADTVATTAASPAMGIGERAGRW